jgi:hypothetical protein
MDGAALEPSALPATQPRSVLRSRASHVETKLGINLRSTTRMAYIAVSCEAQNAQRFRHDRWKLPDALSHDLVRKSAHVSKISELRRLRPVRLDARPKLLPCRTDSRKSAPADAGPSAGASLGAGPGSVAQTVPPRPRPGVPTPERACLALTVPYCSRLQ